MKSARPRRITLNKYPMSSDNLGWHLYYAKRYSKTLHHHTEWLAIWYLLLHLRDSEVTP